MLKKIERLRNKAWNRLMMANPAQYKACQVIYQHYDEIYRELKSSEA